MSVEVDPWTHLRRFTPARIALGRAGAGLPTAAALELALAHARARDAVHEPLDTVALRDALGPGTIVVASAAPDRATYLRRPDLGRRLGDGARDALTRGPDERDLVIVVADGLSARAAARHGPPLLRALAPLLDAAGVSRAPPVVATQARVALGDAVADALGARAVLMLLGERPGLSAPDSLGAYLTFAPRAGRTTDAERNCVSNVRPEGLGYGAAAARIAWLVRESLRLRLTGVRLKDRSEVALSAGQPPAPALGDGRPPGEPPRE